MTGDFERVTHSAQTSAIAMAGRRMIAVMAVAWASSAVGARWTKAEQAFARATPAARLRWWTIAIGVAAVAHVGLRSLMSLTIAPAMPLAVYIVIAAGSALIAWQAGSFHRASRGSWVVGLGSWVMRREQDPGRLPQDPGPKTQDPDDGN